MINNLTLINARLPGQSHLQNIQIEGGMITAIDNQPQQGIDLAGDWLSLGGVDLQINGGLGLAFPDLKKSDFPKLDKICQFLWEQGIDGFLPTLVTTSREKIHQSLDVIKEWLEAEHPTNRAKVLGVHLEGPFLNPAKRGAHPQEYILPLTLANLKAVLKGYEGIVKVITLAVELDPSGETLKYLHSHGITISLGHSLANAQQAQQAFTQGASMVTHAFNAMPGLHHREPGLLGAALVNDKVYCGAIADGKHICPTMLQLLLRSGNNIFLVSDALAPIGLPDGTYPWDNRQIIIEEGTAKLPDGTLAGTTLPLLIGAQNLVKWGISTPERAIRLVTEAPRQAISLPTLAVGQPANLLRWWVDKENQLIWERLSADRN